MVRALQTKIFEKKMEREKVAQTCKKMKEISDAFNN